MKQMSQKGGIVTLINVFTVESANQQREMRVVNRLDRRVTREIIREVAVAAENHSVVPLA
jgi:hypothetical protein